MSPASKSALGRLFDKYDRKSNDQDTTTIDGTMAYFTALGVDPTSVDTLIVSEIVKSPSLGEITRDGFTTGWSEHGCDTLDRQKRYITSRRSVLSSDPFARKNLYTNTFKLGLTETNQRTIQKVSAMGFWEVLLAPPMMTWKTASRDWLKEWLEFVAQSNTKGVNRDVWEQTLKFAHETLRDESLSWWDENSAWPALIDEFVEWIKEKYGAGTKEDEEMEY